jgi:hypothetical protein
MRSPRALAGACRRWLTAHLNLLTWVAGLAVLGWLQGPALLASFEYSQAPFHINDDAQQQIYPFYRYLGPGPFDTDYVADYYLACFPLGYWALFAGAARLGIDPTVLSHVLPHLLWLLTAAGLAAVAYRLAGNLPAFCVLALSLGSDAYLERMAGGLPRTFGYPILSLALVGLAYARTGWCVASVLLGALFYPVAGVISGLALVPALLLPESTGCRVSSRSLRARWALLGTTAALSVAVLLPSLIAGHRFGDPVRPAELSAYPEIGPGGRYGDDSRPPFKGFLNSIPDALEPALLAATNPWSPSARAWLIGEAAQPWDSRHYRRTLRTLLVIVLLGAAGLLLRERAARRVALLGAASALGYQLAVWAMPYAYLPERYSVYTGALIGTLAVASSSAGFFPRWFDRGRRRWARTSVVAAQVALLLWLFAGRVPEGAGINIDFRRHQALLDFIGTLPENAFIAAWPRGITNGIAYAGRRRAFVTFETHQAFHREYIEEMRDRMRALIDAYFATSLGPIEWLRDHYGVTHLMIETSHFERWPPSYFKPFDQWIDERWQAAQGNEFELPRQISNASVFHFSDYEVLDLSRLRQTERP